MNSKNISLKTILWAILGCIILVAIDQAAKIWAVDFLKDQEAIIWIPNVFELQYVENRGAAFGILQNQRWLFVFCVLIVVGFICVFYGKIPNHKRYVPMRLICVFLSAGAVGNVIDRIFRGFVVDLFYFSLINFPVFNVADIYVTMSMICLLLLILFYYKEEDFKFIK